jgi:hypothetical protein
MLGASKDFRFLEMSSLLQTFTSQSQQDIVEHGGDDNSETEGDEDDDFDGTDESGINALNLSLSHV